MKESAKMVVVLVIVSLLSAVSLSMVYEKAQPLIYENKQIELKNSLQEVIPNVHTFKENNGLDEILSEEREGIKGVFDAYNEEGYKVGEAILIDAIGFGGTIKILVGMNIPYRKITGIKILEHLETPGLGERINEPEFLNQFKDASAKTNTYEMDDITGATMPAQTVIEDRDIDGITGATISSTAVIQAVIYNVNKISSQILEPGKITATELLTENQSAAITKDQFEKPIMDPLTPDQDNFTKLNISYKNASR